MWQLAQGTVVCAPVSGKPVLLWLKLAGIHAVVLWHTWHCCGNPAAVWFGLLVFWKSFRWQETHAVLRLVNCPFGWQLWHCSVACAPVSGQPLMAWLKFTFIHELVLWQVAQLVGNPAVMWLGLLVIAQSLAWQPRQSTGVPLKRPPTWQAVHPSEACMPVRAKPAKRR